MERLEEDPAAGRRRHLLGGQRDRFVGAQIVDREAQQLVARVAVHRLGGPVGFEYAAVRAAHEKYDVAGFGRQ